MFVLQKCVTALEKTWHMEHFFCAQCGKQFGEEGFHEKEGKPYCRDDYFDMFAPKCGACNRAIMENYISALNSQWHPDCFVCRVSFVRFARVFTGSTAKAEWRGLHIKQQQQQINFIFIIRTANCLYKENRSMPSRENPYALHASALTKRKKRKTNAPQKYAPPYPLNKNITLSLKKKREILYQQKREKP